MTTILQPSSISNVDLGRRFNVGGLFFDLSLCLSLHARTKVSKTMSIAKDTAPEISRLMPRACLKPLHLLLWDSATVALVSLFTS